MRPSLLPLLAALVLLAPALAAEGAVAWYDVEGQRIEGRPVAFEFETKTLRFETADGGEVLRTSSELSFRGRQRLFLSPLFLQSLPEARGGSEGGAERGRYLLILVLTPALFLFAGFWVAALLVARKAHPLRAVAGFLGSWIVGSLFVLFYVFFAQRFGGGFKVTLVGVGLGLVALSFLISAIYHCGVFEGLLVFLAHYVAGGFLFVVTIAFSEAMLGESRTSQMWEERVFVPTGLMPALESAEGDTALRPPR